MTSPERPRVAFIYGTREGLRTGIARDLLAEKSAIRDTLMRCEQLIRERLGWSLHDVCAAEQFASQEVGSPVLTALQLALTDGWRERGVEPDVIAARSGGEFAAEYTRGTLTLENAVELACRISDFIRNRRGAGRTLLIRLGLSEAERLQQAGPTRFYIVWDVADDRTLIACETAAIEEFKAFFAAHGIEYHGTASGIAPHSPLIDEWRTDLLRPLSDATSDPPPIPYYSASAQGRDEGASYPMRLWRAMREPALTGRMLDSLIADGCTIFLEMSGQPFDAGRIQRRAAIAGKRVITLPRPRQQPAQAVATVDGKPILGLSMPRERPFHAVMDEAQEILHRAGVSIRPNRVAKEIPV